MLNWLRSLLLKLRNLLAALSVCQTGYTLVLGVSSPQTQLILAASGQLSGQKPTLYIFVH